jgi:hypothetical protein
MATPWFRRVLAAARGVVVTSGEDFILERLGTEHGVASPTRELAKGAEYMTIRVKASRIVNVRRWTSTYYGCIQARTSYLHEKLGAVEFQTVVVPELMKHLDPRNLGQVILVDRPIVGPVPYVGGVALELGLFSIKGGDLAGPYIELLTSLAEASGVGFFMQALPFIEPLRKGADLLFGNADQSELEIGLDQSWETVRTGTWLLMRAPKGSVRTGELRLDPDDHRLTDAQGKPFHAHPYLIFAVEGSTERDDWMLIPELNAAWDAIGEAAKRGDLNDAEQLLRNFELVCNWSADLIPSDAERLVKKARAKLPGLQQGTGMAGSLAPEHPLGELKDLNLYDR